MKYFCKDEDFVIGNCPRLDWPDMKSAKILDLIVENPDASDLFDIFNFYLSKRLPPKYVNGEKGFVIFNPGRKHSQMASLVGRVISAGFIRVLDDKLIPYGRSESLGVDSSQEDYNTINEIVS